jgi:hypothetical protein
VLISMLISWGILIALAGVTYLLITLGLGLWPVFGILAAILIALCIIVTIRMDKVTEKYYCQG